MTPTKSYPYGVVNVFTTEPLSAATSSCSKKVAAKDRAAVDRAWLDLSGLRSLKFKCGRHTICERTGNENGQP
jgi:hypothetical protein